jgi:WD40 repeat protein
MKSMQRSLVMDGDPGGIRIFPDSRHAVISSPSDGKLRLWDLETNKEVTSLTGFTDLPRQVDVSADGSLVACASSDGIVRVWRIPR